MGFWSRLFGKEETSPARKVDKAETINYEELVTTFQGVAITFLSNCHSALQRKDKKTALSLTENFHRVYVRFTDHREGFRKKGGRALMAYRIIIHSMGKVYQVLNPYLSGNSSDEKQVIRKITEAQSVISDIYDVGAAAAK
jgi:hypothetical protein